MAVRDAGSEGNLVRNAGQITLGGDRRFLVTEQRKWCRRMLDAVACVHREVGCCAFPCPFTIHFLKKNK